VYLQLIFGATVLFLLGLIYLPPTVKHRWEVKFMVAQVSKAFFGVTD